MKHFRLLTFILSFQMFMLPQVVLAQEIKKDFTKYELNEEKALEHLRNYDGDFLFDGNSLLTMNKEEIDNKILNSNKDFVEFKLPFTKKDFKLQMQIKNNTIVFQGKIGNKNSYIRQEVKLTMNEQQVKNDLFKKMDLIIKQVSFMGLLADSSNIKGRGVAQIFSQEEKLGLISCWLQLAGHVAITMFIRKRWNKGYTDEGTLLIIAQLALIGATIGVNVTIGNILGCNYKVFFMTAGGVALMFTERSKDRKSQLKFYE
jgi:hypothetical protein